jgi:AcrR family transcriptional regulator
MPRTEAQNQAIKLATRQKILTAAMQLFSTLGYQHASVAKIAAEAKISKGLIYHHFASKEDILEGLLDLFWEQEKNFTPDFSLPPKTQLRNLINQIFNSAKAPDQAKFSLSLSLNVYNLTPVKKYITQKIERNITHYSEVFAELGYASPELESWYFAGALSGIMLHVITASSHYPVDEMKDFLLTKYELQS